MAVDPGTEAGYPDPCVVCEPSARPPETQGSRRRHDHIAVRFGDHAAGWQVKLEGITVTDIVVEALGGDPGMLLVMTSERHGDHAEMLVRRGRVELERPGRR